MRAARFTVSPQMSYWLLATADDAGDDGTDMNSDTHLPIRGQPPGCGDHLQSALGAIEGGVVGGVTEPNRAHKGVTDGFDLFQLIAWPMSCEPRNPTLASYTRVAIPARYSAQTPNGSIRTKAFFSKSLSLVQIFSRLCGGPWIHKAEGPSLLREADRQKQRFWTSRVVT
jgi:hypothetical protein